MPRLAFAPCQYTHLTTLGPQINRKKPLFFKARTQSPWEHLGVIGQAPMCALGRASPHNAQMRAPAFVRPGLPTQCRQGVLPNGLTDRPFHLLTNHW